MAETMTPAKVTAAKADAAAEAKAAATKLDEAPPVADPVHSMLGSMLVAMQVLADLVPGSHLFVKQHLDPMRAALAAMTAPPK
jgi:hypothetical protein